MKLYKYVPPERVDILENGKIAFTPPGRFKDPFEFRPELAETTARALMKDTVRQHAKELIPNADTLSARQLKKARSALLKKADEQGVLARTRESFTKVIATNANRDLGVLCLSAVGNDNLMWYHYADGHRGFVIEFDSEQAEFKSLGKQWKIDYVSSQPVYDHRVGNIDFFRYKPNYLNFEQEFRIIRPLKELVAVKSGGTDLLYFWSLPLVCVQAVYLGHRIDGRFRDRILKAIQGTHTRKFETIPKGPNFNLTFHEI